MIQMIIKEIKNLTLQRIVLAIITASAALILYTLYEQRTGLYNDLKTSTYTLASVAMGVVLIVTAAIAAMFVRMSELRFKDTHEQMVARIALAEKHSAAQDIEIARLRGDSERNRIAFEVEMERERQSCDKRIAAIVQTMTAHGIVDRRNGPPA